MYLLLRRSHADGMKKQEFRGGGSLFYGVINSIPILSAESKFDGVSYSGFCFDLSHKLHKLKNYMKFSSNDKTGMCVHSF